MVQVLFLSTLITSPLVNIKYDGCKADAGGQGKVCEGDVITEEMKSRGKFFFNHIYFSSTSIKKKVGSIFSASFNFMYIFFCLAGEPRTFYFGFCFGVVCLSVVFLIIGIVLLILDHFNPDPKEEEEGQEMKAA